MTDDLVARLRSYNPPDRTIDEQRQIAQDIHESADEIERLRGEISSLKDAGEMLWVVVANASEGDWSKQTPEWQSAATRWRDNFFAVCKTRR